MTLSSKQLFILPQGLVFSWPKQNIHMNFLRFCLLSGPCLVPAYVVSFHLQLFLASLPFPFCSCKQGVACWSWKRSVWRTFVTIFIFVVIIFSWIFKTKIKWDMHKLIFVKYQCQLILLRRITLETFTAPLSFFVSVSVHDPHLYQLYFLQTTSGVFQICNTIRLA